MKDTIEIPPGASLEQSVDQINDIAVHQQVKERLMSAFRDRTMYDDKPLLDFNTAEDAEEIADLAAREVVTFIQEREGRHA